MSHKFDFRKKRTRTPFGGVVAEFRKKTKPKNVELSQKHRRFGLRGRHFAKTTPLARRKKKRERTDRSVPVFWGEFFSGNRRKNLVWLGTKKPTRSNCRLRGDFP